MVDTIIKLLNGGDFSKKEISKKLKIDKDLLEVTLSRMIKEGIVLETNNDKYRLVSKTNLKKGIIKERKNASLVVKIEDKEIKLLNPNKLKDKDIVLVEVDNRYGKNDEVYGRVIRIIDRYNPNIVCEVIKRNDKHYAIYKDELIELYGNNLDNLTSGYMVLLKKELDSNKAKVLDIVGHKDDADIEILSLAYEKGFSNKFSKEYLEEIEKLPTYLSEELILNLIDEEGYVDLRNKTLFTIDSKTTNDIDDAAGLINNDNGTKTLVIPIALPAYYIKRDSIIYQRVTEQGTSTYPCGKAIHLNHPRLSNELCSLNEESDRLALTYFITYDEFGNTKNIKLMPSLINSVKKMTYEEVNELLEENNIVKGYEDYEDILRSMNELKEVLKRKMDKEGFLKFYSPEVKISYDNLGNQKFSLRENRSAEELIEYFMLSTNENVTTYLSKRGLKLIYRVHEDANQEKLQSAMSFIARKYNVDIKEHYSNEDIQRVLRLLKGTKEEKIYNSLLIRCMSKAKFSSQNVGHYATGKKCYGMHTSPIRRGADFINQLIILDYLKYGVEYTNMLWEDELEELAKHFNERENAADELERKLLQNEQAKYLQNHIGESFVGLISSVTDFGFYVEIDGMFEGLVNKATLGKVKYIPEIYSYMDKDTKKLYSLGDEVEIIVKNVTDDKKVDFELVGEIYEKKEEKGKVKVRVK